MAAQDLPVKQLSFPRDLSIDNPPNWAYDAANGRLLLGVDRKGLYATHDVGESWSRVDDGTYRGIHGATEQAGWLVPGRTKGSLYSLVRGVGELPDDPSFLRSLDDGRTWQPVNLDGVTPEAWRLVFAPGSPDAFFMLTMYPETDDTDQSLIGPRIWFSPDGGRTVRRFDDFPPQHGYTISDIGIVGSRLCVAAVNERRPEMYDGKLRCRETAGGAWQNLVVEPAHDKHHLNLDRFWTDKSGAIAVLGSDGLYASSDGGKSFAKRLAVPQGPDWIFLHPTDVYPAYLSVIDASAHTIVYRLDADYSLTKLGPLQGFLQAVDFAQGAGIFENLTEKRFYRVELR